MSECPTCGKSLETEQGKRQHHAKVHGESLPNRTCEGCGSEFYDPKARLSYCDDCEPNAGENNGNWKDARERAECERCGDEFEYYPSDKNGVYCPGCVREADEFLGDHYAEVHDIDRVERECEHCGEEFSALPCTLRDGGVRFCSRECVSDALYNGRSDPGVYNGDWYQVRRRALDRDDHRCQNCGKRSEEIGREPDVHHITPIREFDDPQEAHSLGNVVTLCRSCHRLAESGEIPPEKLRPN
ncbi:HNH endonuclease [Halosimplex halobium]|uniref:HNH endonuclease n=1 Tax=Halosimplex halobium TaxID=3396618 RepID=UPI003F569D76